MNNNLGVLSTRAHAVISAFGALTDGIAATSSRWNDRAERLRVAEQLSALSDRELADVGLTRADIPAVTTWGTERRHAGRAF